jgi:hypothetical protein
MERGFGIGVAIVVVTLAVVVAIGVEVTHLPSTVVSQLPPDGLPRAIGVAVAKSTDGTNWTLTFTVVPSGLSPSSFLLVLLGENETTLLPPTPLSSLSGGVVQLNGSAGWLFVAYHGLVPGYVSAGDVLSIGATFAGTATPTEGCEVQLWVGSTVLYQGTLQI